MSEQSRQFSGDEPAAPGADAGLEQRLELAYEQESRTFARPRLLSRRSLMWMFGGLLSTTVMGTGYARFVEPTHAQIDSITLSIAGLPAHLAGKRIAQISDVHVGAYFTPDE